MADITDQLQFATSTPQDAVKNIDDARVFEMGADQYRESKSYLQNEADLLKLNTTVTRGVAEYSSLSSEHSSLIKNDTLKLSQVENLFTQSKEKIDGTEINKKINDLKVKQSSKPNEFTEDDAVNLFMLEDDLKTRSNFKVEKPGKNDELVNKYFEKQKDTNTFKSMFNSYGGALSSTLAGVSQIPTLLYDAYYYPANLIRRFKGEPEITTPESLTKNPVYQKYSKMADDFNALAPELNKDVTDSIANGDFIEAGQIAAVKLSAAIPNLSLTIGATLVGGPAVGMLAAGGTSATQANIENKEKGLSPTQALPNALTKGVIEAGMERIGTISAFKRLESSLTYSFGKDSASKVIFNMFKSMLGSAGQEATEEGLTSVAQDLTDVVSGVAPEKLEGIGGRAIESALIGGLMGGGLVAPAAAAKAKSNIYLYGQVQDNQRKAVDFLNFDSDVTKALEILKDTDMGKISTPETAQFLQTIFKGIGLDSVYLDKESLQAWANTPEKALAVRNIINPTGEAAAAINAPIKVPAHEFFALTFEFPDVQEQYKLSPEGASIKQATEFLNSVSDANDKRQEVLSKLEVPDPTPDDIKMIGEALDPEQPSAIYPSSDVFGEVEYLDLSKMQEALKGVMPESEIPKFLEDQLKARQEIVDNINETATYEMNQVVDVGLSETLEFEKEAQMQRLENNPNVETVDRFANPLSLPNDTILQSVEGFENTHSKPGFSPLAIDPSSLPEDLKALKGDARLKKNKVFVKGGINVNDAAALLGYGSPQELLDVLLTTPSREEIAEQRTQARKADIEAEVRDQVGLNEIGITKAYAARLTNALETMKIMKDKFWSSTKTGFKRIALTPPTPKALMAEARKAVYKSKVGDLNVNQFKVGERKSERMAWDAITKNQVEKAYRNQQAVAKNIALAAQTQLAVAKVNRIIKLARKFNKPTVIQELKDAGPLYLEAAQEILESFNLTSRKKDDVEKGSFKKWSEKVAKEGQGNYTIPPRLMDQRQSLSEMSVEQVLAAGNALQVILHTAKYKNKLFRKHQAIKGLQTLESIGNQVEENAKKVFDYDKGRVDVLQDMNWLEEKGEFLLNMKTYLERTQHIIAKLDDGKSVGFFNDLFWRPLVDASNNKKTLLEETRVHLEKLIETFGKKEFDSMSNETVVIEEFKGFPGFRTGTFSKAQLFAMELNFGNEGNIVELEKYGVTRETIRKVLDRELSEKHTALAQNMWNIFESFKPEMQKLQKRTEGRDDVEWVEAKPFEARGKQYPGGYYPILRLADKAKIAAKKAQGVGVMSSLENFKLNYYGDAMTEQGHLESRTGNDDFLNLDLTGLGYSLNQVIHDLTHREVIADGVKLLADKKIRDNIVSVVGKDGYSNIVGTYISTAEEVENDSYGENPVLKFINNFANGVQIVAIGGKLNSVLIQPASLLVALDKMGKAKSLPYFSKTINDLMMNPSLIPAFYKFAEDLNPAIRQFTEDVSKNSSTALNSLMPEKTNKALTPIKGATEFATTMAFKALSEVDKLNKVLVTLVAYQMAIEGKVDGVTKGDYEGAAKYASNMSELTQTHNDIRNLPPAQKNKYMKMFLFFYNDLNNLYNNTIAQSREVRKQFKKGNTWSATVTTASFMLTLILLKMYEGAIRGNPLPGDDDDEKDMESFTKAWAKYLLWQPVEAIISTLPFARDINYAKNKFWEKRKNVQLPLESGFSEIATSISALTDYVTMIDEGKDLSPQERKALWMSAGILFKIPTGSIYDIFIREKRDDEYLKKGLLDRLTSLTKSITQSPEVSQQFKEDLDKLEARLNPRAVDIPSQTYTTVKEMLSNSNPTAYNEENGAAGIYQFTEEVWNGLMQDAPELALTENGRVMKKTEQQQRAFEYTSKQSGEILRASGFSTTPENLYGSHIVGPLKLVEVLTAEDDVRINTLVDPKILKAYGVDSDVTVGGFKDWLLFKVVEAEERLTNESNK